MKWQPEKCMQDLKALLNLSPTLTTSETYTSQSSGSGERVERKGSSYWRTWVFFPPSRVNLSEQGRRQKMKKTLLRFTAHSKGAAEESSSKCMRESPAWQTGSFSALSCVTVALDDCFALLQLDWAGQAAHFSTPAPFACSYGSVLSHMLPLLWLRALLALMILSQYWLVLGCCFLFSNAF